MTRVGSGLPIVGIPCCRREIGALPYHAVGDKYARAIRAAAGALPILLPVFGDHEDEGDWLDLVDGIFLTGSASNVDPAWYGGDRAEMLLDRDRDAATLPLIRKALEAGLPLFAVCRGLQEMNVALGGTLFVNLSDIPGRFDHRDDPDATLDVQYGPAHPVTLRPGGLIANLTGRDHLIVNSLHGQGIDRLAEDLEVEAHASDGTIEAVTVKGARTFALGVQWHPEWRVMDHPLQRAIFEAFGEALRRNRQ